MISLTIFGVCTTKLSPIMPLFSERRTKIISFRDYVNGCPMSGVYFTQMH